MSLGLRRGVVKAGEVRLVFEDGGNGAGNNSSESRELFSSRAFGDAHSGLAISGDKLTRETRKEERGGACCSHSTRHGCTHTLDISTIRLGQV